MKLKQKTKKPPTFTKKLMTWVAFLALGSLMSSQKDSTEK